MKTKKKSVLLLIALMWSSQAAAYPNPFDISPMIRDVKDVYHWFVPPSKDDDEKKQKSVREQRGELKAKYAAIRSNNNRDADNPGPQIRTKVKKQNKLQSEDAS
jgi:hypothetical protein